VHTKVYELRVPASPEQVWKFHSSAESLKKLTPPNRKVRFLTNETKVEENALHTVRLLILGFIPVTWKARISQVTPPFGFTDQAEKSPFKFWRHRHDFIPDGDGTLIRDTVAYIVPGGKLGKAINKLHVEKDLDRLFAYRHEVTKMEFTGR
jgi:ligand-binding SRPBCC domain-containing protein